MHTLTADCCVDNFPHCKNWVQAPWLEGDKGETATVNDGSTVEAGLSPGRRETGISQPDGVPARSGFGKPPATPPRPDPGQTPHGFVCEDRLAPPRRRPRPAPLRASEILDRDKRLRTFRANLRRFNRLRPDTVPPPPHGRNGRSTARTDLAAMRRPRWPKWAAEPSSRAVLLPKSAPMTRWTLHRSWDRMLRRFGSSRLRRPVNQPLPSRYARGSPATDRHR